MEEVLKDRFSRKKKILLVVIIVSMLPIFLFVAWPQALGDSGISIKEYTLFATSVFGLIGTVLMLWQFILGTRVIMRRLLPDMVWSLKLHKWLGIYGSLFVWLHPILGVYSLSLSVWYIFIPNFSSRYETYISYGRIAFLLFVVIWVTSALIRGRIKYRPWKYIHLSSYVILPLVFLHAVVSGIQLSRSNALLYYWYGLVILYLIIAALRVGHQFGYGKQPHKLVGLRTKADVALLQLQPTKYAIEPKPGQYVYMQFDSVFSESHPFTVTDYNSSTGVITLAIKKFGRFTEKVLSAAEYKTIYIDGPYGVFTDELNRLASSASVPVAMFSGGIGVTPYLQHVQSSTVSDDTILFNCNRNPDAALFADMLKSRLRGGYVDVYSQAGLSKDSGSGGNVEFGRISTSIVRKYLKQEPGAYLYFICGPEPFMNLVKDILAELGVPKEQIRLEEFSF